MLLLLREKEATLLTVDVEADPLADSWRDVIPGDAEVSPHLGPGHSSDSQVLPLVLLVAPLVPGGVPDDVLTVLTPPGDPWGGMTRSLAH